MPPEFDFELNWPTECMPQRSHPVRITNHFGVPIQGNTTAIKQTWSPPQQLSHGLTCRYHHNSTQTYISHTVCVEVSKRTGSAKDEKTKRRTTNTQAHKRKWQIDKHAHIRVHARFAPSLGARKVPVGSPSNAENTQRKPNSTSPAWFVSEAEISRLLEEGTAAAMEAILVGTDDDIIKLRQALTKNMTSLQKHGQEFTDADRRNGNPTCSTRRVFSKRL